MAEEAPVGSMTEPTLIRLCIFVYMGSWVLYLLHMAFRKKYPDRPETRAVPYEGIENLRPETKALVKSYLDARKLLE